MLPPCLQDKGASRQGRGQQAAPWPWGKEPRAQASRLKHLQALGEVTGQMAGQGLTS